MERGKLSGFRPVKYPCIHLAVTQRERERERERERHGPPCLPSFQRRPTSQRGLNGHARTHNMANESNGWTDGQPVVGRGRWVGPLYIPGWLHLGRQ